MKHTDEVEYLRERYSATVTGQRNSVDMTNVDTVLWYYTKARQAGEMMETYDKNFELASKYEGFDFKSVISLLSSEAMQEKGNWKEEFYANESSPAHVEGTLRIVHKNIQKAIDDLDRLCGSHFLFCGVSDYLKPKYKAQLRNAVKVLMYPYSDCRGYGLESTVSKFYSELFVLTLDGLQFKEDVKNRVIQELDKQ